jgi:hypothetical protein
MRCQGRAAAAILIPVAALLAGCHRRSSAPPAPAARAQPSWDADYVAALAAANRFCHAWRQRDLRAGKDLLSTRIKRTFPEARIRDALVGAPNPEHAAFELSDGERVEDGRVVFRLRLFFRYAGRAADRIEAPSERIVLVRDAAGQWHVDEFPLLVRPGP